MRNRLALYAAHGWVPVWPLAAMASLTSCWHDRLVAVWSVTLVMIMRSVVVVVVAGWLPFPGVITSVGAW